MAKIGNQPPPGMMPRAPLWPWGGPRSVREKLVDPTQFRDKKKLGKKGDPKNPSLASAALLDSIGPAHSAEEMRLPMPPHPEGHDADLESFKDHGGLLQVAERADPESRRGIERGLSMISAAPDRVERMKALLGREQQMLTLVGQLTEEINDIQRKIREETKNEGF